MHARLRAYVEALFADAPQTIKTMEIKEEILQNTIQRYDDLCKEGKSEQAAFHIAVTGIGDVSELIDELQKEAPQAKTAPQAPKDQASAILLAVAVMLYILCVLPVILLGNIAGICMMFVMIALATGVLIYRGKMHGQGKAEQADQSSVGKESDDPINKSIRAAIGSITLIVYLLISFATGAWHITWLIFPISGAIRNVIKACMDLKEASKYEN